MPIYTYACHLCQLIFHRHKGVQQDSSLYTCPKCSSAADKIMMPTNFASKAADTKIKDIFEGKPYGYEDYEQEDTDD